MPRPTGKQFHMYLYHGTSASHLPEIMESGLGSQEYDPRVYLTNDQALADWYAGHHEDPVVLKVRANPRRLRVDWNSFEEPVHHMTKNRDFDESKIKDPSKDWRNSLKQTGATMHQGAIDASDIIDIERL